jgi:hypothetical protein
MDNDRQRPHNDLGGPCALEQPGGMTARANSERIDVEPPL